MHLSKRIRSCFLCIVVSAVCLCVPYFLWICKAYNEIIPYDWITRLRAGLPADYAWCRRSQRGTIQTCHTDQKPINQEDLNAMAQSLSVKFAVVSNVDQPGDLYMFSVTFENTGDRAVGGACWEIRFCSMYMLFPQQNIRGPDGIEVSHGISVSHVNGCHFRMFPTSGQVVFETNKPITLSMVAQFWMIAATDVMPNWYISADDLQPKIITSTAVGTDFVSPFDSPAKWKRQYNDRYNPITPAERYGYYQPIEGSYNRPRPVPRPSSMMASSAVSEKSGLIGLDAKWVLHDELDLLALKFFKTHKFLLGTLGALQQKNNVDCVGQICLQFTTDSNLANEGYTLSLSPESRTIHVRAKDDSGALAAAKTLYQLKVMNASFSTLLIEDAPRYSYRGMMLDIVRHFQTRDALMRFIDAISLFKLNYLHLHLTDDEGWRLEIDGLPELTEVASRTCDDPTELCCILPQLGALPYGKALFLTKDDYKALLLYAEERGIQIIPEIDMPGHSHAAIKAMEARYKNSVTAGNSAAAMEYLLSDVQDNSFYYSAQKFTDNAMNPCLYSTYRFVEKVVHTIQRYHSEVGQQLKFIHLGGDEVPAGAWMHSPVCQHMIGDSEAEVSSASARLKKHFVQAVYKITSMAGLGLAMWEDGFMEAGEPYPLADITKGVPEGNRQPLYAFVWQNVWEWGSAKRAYQVANAGYKVVLVPATHFYFDHAQEPDPEERGLYWATRFTGTNKTFSFMPDDMYANMNHDLSRFGEPLSKATLCPDSEPSTCPALDQGAKSNIIGIEATLFSETCHTESYLHGLVFPRVLALAERAWHKAAWESIVPDTSAEYYAKRRADWGSFSASLGQHLLPLLDARGIDYHLNPPGVIELNGVWLANSEFWKQAIEYSTDGGQQWLPFNRNSPPTTKSGPALFSTVAVGSRKRRSRVIKVTPSTTS